MAPLSFQTMMIVPLIEPRRLKLQGTHDIVHCVAVCWAVKYHMRNSLIEVCDYYLQTLGMDGVQ